MDLGIVSVQVTMFLPNYSSVMVLVAWLLTGAVPICKMNVLQRNQRTFLIFTCLCITKPCTGIMGNDFWHFDNRLLITEGDHLICT